MDIETVTFPAVAFPSDFREQIMKGSKRYDLDYLIKRGFVVVYTSISTTKKAENFDQLIATLGKIIEENSNKVFFADLGDKDFSEYFNDILFHQYELMRGIKMVSHFPLNILLLVSALTPIFTDEPGVLYMQAYSVQMDDKEGRVDFIMISNKKDMVDEPFAQTILEAHKNNMRERLKDETRKEQSKIINNGGIIIQGNNNSLSNVGINSDQIFEPIIKEIKDKKLENEKEVISAVEDVKKNGKSSKSLKFLQDNVPWVASLVGVALDMSNIFTPR